MPNAKDYRGLYPNVLTAGYPGSGKSTQLITIPGKKFAYVFDPNAVDSYRGADIEYEAFLPEDIGMDAVPLSGKKDRDRFSTKIEPRMYVNFEVDFEDRLSDGFFDQFDVITFDGITGLTELVQDRIMFLNDRFGKWPEFADHTATINTVTNVLRRATSLQKMFYLTGHIDFMKNEKTGTMMNVMSFLGALRRRIPLLFSNLWLTYAEEDETMPAGTRWLVQTRPDRYNPFLRSSVRELERVEDVTIDWTRDPIGQGIGRLLTLHDQ